MVGTGLGSSVLVSVRLTWAFWNSDYVTQTWFHILAAPPHASASSLQHMPVYLGHLQLGAEGPAGTCGRD